MRVESVGRMVELARWWVGRLVDGHYFPIIVLAGSAAEREFLPISSFRSGTPRASLLSQHAIAAIIIISKISSFCSFLSNHEQTFVIHCS